MHAFDVWLCNIIRKRDPDPEATDKEKYRLEEMQQRISKRLQAAPVEELDEDELEWLMGSTDITSIAGISTHSKLLTATSRLAATPDYCRQPLGFVLGLGLVLIAVNC